MSNDKDFVIENGVLTEYTGKGGDVVIPDGVTKIGWGAFEDCTWLTSVTIPESVTEIGCGAFAGCTGLTSVTIPEGVTKIGGSAFYGCAGLTSVTIPESVTEIGYGAFAGCTGLTSITIPDSVTEIGEGAFEGCAGLTSVTIPDGVTEIGDDTFSDCTGLTSVTIPDSVTSFGVAAFSGVPAPVLEPIFQRGMKLDNSYAEEVSSPVCCACAILYQSGKVWDAAVAKYMNAAPENPDKVLAALGQMAGGKSDKKMVNFAVANLPVFSADGVKSFYQALHAAQSGALKTFMKNEAVQAILLGANNEDDLHPVERMARKKVYPRAKEIAKLVKEGVKYADSEGACSADALVTILAAYAEQEGDAPKYYSEYQTSFCETKPLPEIDAIAAGLDQQALREKLEGLAYEHGGALLIPFGRYADAKQITALISNMRKWADWSWYDAAGRQNIIRARGGLMLSDTREAMMAVDKVGGLDYYAEIRGTDAETLRDTVLADFGLDEKGQKVYDLGGKTVTVSLADDLTLALFDDTAGKTVKSIPKKGADAALVEQAAADFADLKKNVKKVAKTRSDRLFADFLSGEGKPAESWIASYTKNPLLRQIARLLVWSQGTATFTLDAQGKAVDAEGKECTIAADEPIAVAHPMEMTPAQVEAWQKYFTARGLKQPFAQIWEPVRESKAVKEDRYKGCSIPYYRFRNMGKHGITVLDYNFHDGIEITFAGCDAQVERLDWHRHEVLNDDGFEVTRFSFKKYTRQVNHIVALLDKWTVAKRIEADDITAVMDMLPGFTLAQIVELIDLAAEKMATNCTAALLEYKNAHFAGFDPMDAFTLE